MSQQSNVCFIILIGVPGSGKTTFSKHLVEYFESSSSKSCIQHTLPYHVINVCYDELMPTSTYKFEDKGSWCEARKNVFNLVKALVSHLKGLTDTEGGGDNSQYDLSLLVDQSMLMGEMSRILIIIDDNMYYRSMRYKYFQLARAYNLGFCQLYFQCQLQIALQQNAGRSKDSVVPEEIIRKMANTIEFPDPIQHAWEEYTCIIPCEERLSLETFKTLSDMVDRALRYPPPPIVENTAKEVDRIFCSTSVFHQVDISLRKIVRHEMSEKKTGFSKEQLRHTAKCLGIRKQIVLDNIKVGKIKIPEQICLAIEENNPLAGEHLYRFLCNHFIEICN